VQNSAWPNHKRLATRLAEAFRYFTYKHRMLDSFWVPWLVRGTAVPVAVIDFLDTSYVLPKDFALLRAATLYYKLNLYFWPRRSLMPLETFFGRRRVTRLTPKLRPFTNGVPKRSIPAEVRPMWKRDLDLCFTGTIVPNRSADDPDPFGELSCNPIRQAIFERTRAMQKQYRVFCLNGTVSFEEYQELLQRSRLVVCTESFGCETFRHYDVTAAGAVALINWPYAQNHLPLEPDVHAVYFSLIGGDFERTVARALADPERLERIAEAGRAFTIAHKERSIVGAHIIRETLAHGQARR
jgi:hypothetical protein